MEPTKEGKTKEEKLSEEQVDYESRSKSMEASIGHLDDEAKSAFRFVVMSLVVHLTQRQSEDAMQLDGSSLEMGST
jgi:hypothetical protein